MSVISQTAPLLLTLHFIAFVMLNEIVRILGTCPSVCHQIACTTGVLSCPDGGLDQIPEFLPIGTSKILLTNHRFLFAYLQYSNLSNYGPPQFKVIKITIQNCELVGISSNAFSHLSYLSVLDLAYNKLFQIVPDTFNSLTLNFLRLDGNRNVIIHPHSFRGLIVTTLSLIDCAISSIGFESINELSGSLKKLYLTNNKLHTIDRQFKDIFEQLTVLQINDNPINCTCGLQWLSSVLLWRRKRYNSAPITGVISEAQCQSPPSVYNKLLINLSPKDFSCQLPQLKRIDVYMTSNVTAKLTCTSELELHEHPTVRWLSRSNNELTYETQAPESASLSIQSRSNVDNFLCLISNQNGNVTVLVRIQWPGLGYNISTTSHRFNNPMLTARPNSNYSSNGVYFYSKRFTLLEMIGGVVGTFTLTMIIFICIYRYMVVSLRNEHKKKWYISYEPTAGSDSQTYDVPHCAMGSYYTGQLFSNHNSPMRYTDFNGNCSFSPSKTAAL